MRPRFGVGWMVLRGFVSEKCFPAAFPRQDTFHLLTPLACGGRLDSGCRGSGAAFTYVRVVTSTFTESEYGYSVANLISIRARGLFQFSCCSLHPPSRSSYRALDSPSAPSTSSS